ncbi:MAG: hypothetical protein ACJASG_001671, partial [Oleiphilaceae bacterium]
MYVAEETMAFSLNFSAPKYFKLLMVLLVFATSPMTISHALGETATEAIKESVAKQGADIRLLIDISGSMKKNDPSNLRIPAVNLLTELIPDGDKAGVWTFGQWVNNLIQHKVVDDAWRLNAKEQAKKINSVALYTNVGAVLEKASDDFKKKEKLNNTHFILLTDGMVDIDKDPEKNSKERDRVLTTILKTFKDKGAKIHAVSLSKNADSALMDKLAIQTGGQSAVAESSEDLTKIFLQALDQAVPSEQVPIEGNEFVIDSSVEEFTALIFRGDGSIPTVMIGPDEKLHSKSSHSDDVKWYQDKGYDLITIKRPLEGTWKINADIQPDSRVTVVSNLQLDVTRLPVNFFAGDQLKVDVRFVEDGKTVINKDFLSLLDVKLNLKTEENKEASKTISDPSNPPLDGIFSDAIRKLTKVGQYELTVLVDGKTFKRKNRQIINLRYPFDFEFAAKGEGDNAHYQLVVSPLSENISIDETSVFAKIKSPDGSSLIKAVDLDKESGRWILPISADKGDGLYKIAIKVKAKTIEGKKFKFSPKVFEAVFPMPAGEANKIVSVNEEESLPEPEEIVEPEEELVEEQVEEIAPPIEIPDELESSEVVSGGDDIVLDESDLSFWLIVAGAVVAGLGLIGGAVFFIKKKRNKDKDTEEEILSDEVVEEILEDEVAEATTEVDEELDFVDEPEPEPEP